MSLDLRSEIFALREQGVSMRNIADQLGLSLGKVQRELGKRANEIKGKPESNGRAEPEVVAFADPEFRDRQRQIALKRLRLQESDLELREVEQRQRMAILKGGGGEGNQSQLAAQLLLSEVSRLRDEIRDRPGKDSGSLIDQLGQLKTLGNTIASFAPPSAPSSPAEVEFKVALARINLEEQRIAKDREAELAQRQHVAESENMRNDAIARFIEGFGPMLSQVAQRWLEDRSPKPAPQVALPAAPTPAASQPSPETEGACPVCGVALAMSPGLEPEKCPGCGTLIQLLDGRIVQAGQRANGQVGREVERFAS